MDLDDTVLSVQRFTRRWPEVKRFPGEVSRAAGDSDGGFERLLRATLEAEGVPGDVALARALHFHDGREGAVVPQHELDIILRLDDGPCVLEAKAWRDVVDKDPVIVFLGKLLDFIATPQFDAVAPSLKAGFIGLAGFTEAARRIMFSFGVVPFSKAGRDVSFRFLDLQLGRLEEQCRAKDHEAADHVDAARRAIEPFVIFESRKLTSIVHVESDEAVVDLASLRRGAALYGESRTAHALALDAYRQVSKSFAS